MGILDFLLGTTKDRRPCPNCGESLSLTEERCGHCGVHVSSMFRKKCPVCGAANELSASECIHRDYSFSAQNKSPKNTHFVCPICGLESSSYLTRCPSCNTRFM